jgi:hypothetical protein
MVENVRTAPVMAPEGRKLRPRAWGLVVLGIAALALSPAMTTFEAWSEYGGVDDAGNWIDNAGNRVSSAPPVVHVVGHVAPPALALLLLVVVVGVFLPPTLERYGQRTLGDVVRYSAYLAVPVCVLAAFLVYGVWQGHFVMDQVDREVLHPHGFPWGGVTVTTGHMTR